MKIVHIITRFIRGGADENTLYSCNEFAEKHEVHLIVGKDVHEDMLSNLHPRVHLHVVPSLIRNINPFSDLAAFFNLASLVRRIVPDIVHTHTSKAGVLGRLACLGQPGLKVVHGVHILAFENAPSILRRSVIAIERWVGTKTDCFVYVSEGLKKAYIDEKIGQTSVHCVVQSGMYFPVPLKTRAETRAEWSIDESAKVLLYVANLEPRKRHTELVEAFKETLVSSPDKLLVFVGEGEHSAVIKEKIRSVGLEKQIILGGYRSDIADVISASDVCLYASKREGLPRALVQYAYYGKPIIANRLVGIDSIVCHDRNGYIVEPDGFDELVRLSNEVLTNSQLCSRLANGHDKSALLPWSVQNMVNELEVAYGSISDVT